MSKSLFEQRLAGLTLSHGDRQWFPKWFDGYASHCRADVGAAVPMDLGRVISFLQSLRDNRVPAWRRLQAARAMESYQGLVLRTNQSPGTQFRLAAGAPQGRYWPTTADVEAQTTSGVVIVSPELSQEFNNQ